MSNNPLVNFDPLGMGVCTIPSQAYSVGGAVGQCPDETNYNPSNIAGPGTEDLPGGHTAAPGGILFGNDIFDAVSGAPGTYLTYDIHGNIGFQFSPELWTATLNMVDSVRNPEIAHGAALAPYPTSGFQMVVRDLGWSSEAVGLLTDYTTAIGQVNYLTIEEQNLVSKAFSQYTMHGLDVPVNVVNAINNIDNSIVQWMGQVTQMQGQIVQISTGSTFWTGIGQGQ